MRNLANLEARIKALENLYKNETGVGLSSSANSSGGATYYPVRQLTLTEEKSYSNDGSEVITVLVSWKSPAGSAAPNSIRLTIAGETVSVGGSETSYRKTGFPAGVTVKVIAVAVYSSGQSSSVVATITLSGTAEPIETPQFTVTGGYYLYTLSWPIVSAGNYDYMEIWESTENDNFENAAIIATEDGNSYIRTGAGESETRWFWIRAVDTGNNYGLFVGPQEATTMAISSSGGGSGGGSEGDSGGGSEGDSGGGSEGDSGGD